MPSFRIWSHFPPFRRSAIPSFRVWGHFPPFRDSAIPPFRYSTVPSFRLLGSPSKFSVQPQLRNIQYRQKVPVTNILKGEVEILVTKERLMKKMHKIQNNLPLLSHVFQFT